MYYNSYISYKPPMQSYIGNKQSQKLLRVFLLKNAYEVAKGLQKQFANSLCSSCIVIRRTKIKNQTQFGYKQSLKTGFIKKIHFVYLATIDDLIAFLWGHLTSDKILTAGIFVDCIETYFGERFKYEQNGKALSICLNLLSQLSEKVISKKLKMKVAFSFCYNPYVFLRQKFTNFMRSSGITYWQITAKQFYKNGFQYQSEWTDIFLQQYGSVIVKQQTQQ